MHFPPDEFQTWYFSLMHIWCGRVYQFFFNLLAGNHYGNSSMILLVWSILKPRGDFTILKLRGFRIKPSCILISKVYSNNFLSYWSDSSLFIVFIASSINTVKYETVPLENNWMYMAWSIVIIFYSIFLIMSSISMIKVNSLRLWNYVGTVARNTFPIIGVVNLFNTIFCKVSEDVGIFSQVLYSNLCQ